MAEMTVVYNKDEDAEKKYADEVTKLRKYYRQETGNPIGLTVQSQLRYCVWLERIIVKEIIKTS